MSKIGQKYKQTNKDVNEGKGGKNVTKTFIIIIISCWQHGYKVKLATIVEGNPKAPFSIATTPRCRGGRYSIPRIAPLYP